MFKNPFSFEGRIRRTEYIDSILIVFVFYILFEIIKEASELVLLLSIPICWFSFAQRAKRCHDRGNSGWYQFIPFYGFWLLFADSEYGINE